VTGQGGVVAGSDQARASALASPLIAACVGRKIRIQVLATNAVCAFSWASGRVFVTHGLMARLNDEELTAAIAHELGHLLSDGQLQTVASLKGCCVDPDREVRADAAGVALLGAEGLSAAPMIRMLQKVKNDPSLPTNCRAGIEHRLSILQKQQP
jgi:Zn-dependent protease with chaperone function